MLRAEPLDELNSGQGETLEQYAVFREYEQQLELHFESFVASRGFASAADCFAAIDRTVAEDAARQKREVEALQQRLQEMQRELAAAAQREVGSASQAESGGEGSTGADGVPGGAAPTAAMPLLLFAQPIGAKEMMEQALTLAEYPTFSGLMRKKARQVANRRRFIDGAQARADARAVRARLLGAPDADATERVRELWKELHHRVCDSIAHSLPPPLQEMMEAEHGAELEALDGLLATGDTPPENNQEKTSLGRLCATALTKPSRMAPPQLMPAIFAEVQRVSAAVDAAELGRVAVLSDAIAASHGLLDAAEQATEKMMRAADEKAASFRRAFESGQQLLEERV